MGGARNRADAALRMIQPTRLSLLAVASAMALLTLAGCQMVPHAEPVSPPAPAARPAPPPPPPAAQPALSWEEAPVAPGDWSYRQTGADSEARFGTNASAPLLTVRCTGATRRIVLQGAGLGGSALTIRTSYGALEWTADAPVASGLTVTRPAGDPGFDWIAYSRGRIALEASAAPRLIVPVWAELVRVIEDCRA